MSTKVWLVIKTPVQAKNKITHEELWGREVELLKLKNRGIMYKYEDKVRFAPMWTIIELIYLDK